MVGYTELAKLNTFTMDYVNELVGNKKTASSLIQRLLKKDLVRKIRNNLYSAVNVADGQVIASKYHIACAINDTAYLSHHSAFEYMGIANQVFYEIYVSSKKRFADFEFDSITYKFVSSKLENGIVLPKHTQGIRITTLERTIVDSVKDFEKIGGLEELLNCIADSPNINEKEIIKFLDAYNIQFLYQKTGFLLEHFKNQFRLTDEFISYCKKRMGKSTRYLTRESSNYSNEWRLVVPENLFQLTEQGANHLV